MNLRSVSVWFVLPVLTLILFAAPAAQSQRAKAPDRLEIIARPIVSLHASEPDRGQFGALEFLGGLELTSAHRGFGGLSGLVMDPDGENFIALSDRADWVSGRVRYRDGKPDGIADAWIGPMRGPDGQTLASRRWFDTEALTRDGGTLYVGIERVHQVVRFDYGKDGMLARGQQIALPADVSKLPSNKGLECLAFVPQGMPLADTLIGISERGLDEKGDIRGFLIGGASPGNFSVKRSDDFDITDCAVTPNADLIILERRFTLIRGVAMRMRRVPLSQVARDSVIDGPVLILADRSYQIDNMEGLGVHRDARGQIVLTLVSDDNFSPLQRTILLQFTLLDR